MRFVKFHGYGNDYLVFEAARLESVGWRGGFERFDAGEPFLDFVRGVCDRHFGAGADGVAVVEDFGRTDWRRLGRTIESHAAFPERTNVEFVRTLDRQNIEARVWERGAGETLSSGTGACAAAVASMIGGRVDRRVRVQMPGGTLEVLWRDDGEVLLTGTAEVVYRGEWLKGK